jgi:hypothetical protein
MNMTPFADPVLTHQDEADTVANVVLQKVSKFPLIGADRKLSAQGQTDVIDPSLPSALNFVVIYQAVFINVW